MAARTNVYDRLPDDAARALLVDVLLPYAPDLAEDFTRQTTMTNEQIRRVHAAMAQSMRFEGPDFTPTPQTVRIEQLVDIVTRTWPTPSD